MIKHVVLILTCVLCIGCASTIKRVGYRANNAEHTYTAQLNVTKSTTFIDLPHQVVGKIFVADSGVSLTCNEFYVMGLLERDALALNADLVHITRETPPNFVSSCYRVEAEFIRFTNREDVPKVVKDLAYSVDEVKFRDKYESAKLTKQIKAAGNSEGLVGAMISGKVLPKIA